MPPKSERITVRENCESCGATGIYHGFAEHPGEGVICLNCNGKGYVDYTYTPFTARKTRRGITKVYRSKGSFIGAGVGPAGSSITYEEFLNGKMPK